ncbi:MAG TPA: hypothetical protein VK184_24635 [Nostocaceae cyanobacterium]|nr:hypothetical protein [Nostocaceae cyanobacterium]
MDFWQINLYLLLENTFFFLIANGFLIVVGWCWKNTKPYTLPQSLPDWFNIWYGSVQFLGIVVPLLVMLLWGGVWGYTSVVTVLGWYFVMLGLQILTESITLRKYQTVVWVMVPYLYIPYRFWQLYEGMGFLGDEPGLLWVRYLLVLEIVVWVVNYLLDLAQLPRLLRWEVLENSQLSGD